jgi:hypothetical protein
MAAVILQEPVIVDIREPPSNPAQEVVDILVGSFGLAGLMFVAAALIGVLLAIVMFWRKSREDGPVSLTRD